MLLFGSFLTLAAAFAAGSLFFRSLPLPFIARLGLGAAIQSLAIFLLLEAGLGTKPVFLVVGCALAASLFWTRPRRSIDSTPAPLDRSSRWVFILVFGAYTVLYTIHALAPEVQPDAITYHLGLAAEYARLGHFPPRVGFYEVLPQGLEMLFTMALSLGVLSSAKLVHFAFLLGAVPLLLVTGRMLGIGDGASLAAAALYLCMPVAGIAGTSAYNDAALTFFSLLTFYLLLMWHTGQRSGYLAAAGIASGFCFALKLTGLPIALAATLAVLAVSRRVKPALILALTAALLIAPWMLRDLLLTGNPVAPILNAWFPNPFFNSTAEKQLSAVMRSYGNFHWSTAPVEYALRGGMQGVTGPILLLLPFALPALRKRSGRLLFLAAAVTLMPWFWNVGTRFLLPCLPFLLLAFTMSCSRPLLLLCVAAQAVVCWPPIIERLEDPYRWTLRETPWRAAFRLEPEDVYLRRAVGEYPVARMVEEKTHPGDRIFCLTTVARAYTTRESVDYWHSTPNERLIDGMQAAYFRVPMTLGIAEWPPEPLRALRISAALGERDEWRIFELHLFSPGGRVYSSPQWSLDAAPNRWDAPGAFDENRATSWRTRDAVRPGARLETELDHSQILCRLEIFMQPMPAGFPILVHGRTAKGDWKKLADAPRIDPAPRGDLRHEAISAVRRAGFRYILAAAGDSGTSLIGADMLKDLAEWGVEDAGEVGTTHLFRIL